jgi:4-amino-4-deoxy-L-arabinose transferase-like glycosyltransferase
MPTPRPGATLEAARTSNPAVRSISAFFPCYNDAPTIEVMVRRVSDTLTRLVDDFEVIVVDDGSEDGSLDVLRRLQGELPFLRVVAHETNRGYGAALRSGLGACTKQWIFYTDGDGQYDPTEVATLVDAAHAGVGFVQGWKRHRGDGHARALIGRAYHHFVARAFGLKVRDTDCDFRLIRRCVAEQADLRSDSGAICVEMMYRFNQLGARCIETPVQHFPRPHGRSQFFRARHLARTFVELARLWLRLRLPRRERLERAPDVATVPSQAGWSTRTRVLALATIVVASLGLHLWGITHDLPMPAVDEKYFVPPATYIAASGDLNPHWFGHPGSTVIYPLALAFRLREVLFHGAPVIGRAPSIAARLQSDPGSFYLMGRLWAMLLSLAALPLLFAIGRRAFGELVGLLATASWVVVPLAVEYGRITRTDSVALFFALATIYLSIRALERPSVARFAAAGVTAGLGVASRYFLATLVVVLGAAAFEGGRRARVEGAAARRDEHRLRRPAVLLGVALVAMFVTFVITTPFFFLDWHAAVASVDAEASARTSAAASGFVANLRFYGSHAIPSALSWLGVLAALFGIARAISHRTAARILLLLWVPAVLVAISVLPLHWDRWVIPALPIIALFAAYGVSTAARAAATRVGRLNVRRAVFLTTVIAAMLAMTIGPATALVNLDRVEASPSTRVAAQQWVEKHIPSGSKLAVEIKGPDFSGTRYPSVQHFALPFAGTVADYARAGYRYLVVNARLARSYEVRARHHPGEASFYRFLREDARRLAHFDPDGKYGGPHLAIYDLGPGAAPRDRDAAADAPRVDPTLALTSPDRVSRGGGPVPYDRWRLRRMADAWHMRRACDTGGSVVLAHEAHVRHCR